MKVSSLIEQGRRTRAKISALSADGLSDRAIAERLSLSRNRVRELMGEMGLRSVAPIGTRTAPFPAEVANNEAIYHDRESLAFVRDGAAACDAHAADIAAAYGLDFKIASLAFKTHSVPAFLPQFSEFGCYRSSALICSEAGEA